MISLPDKLLSKLEDRAAQNALRQLGPKPDLIDFTSNDYLGFARDESLFQQANDWLAKRGIRRNGSAGSRLLFGNTNLHLEVEAELAKCYDAEAALLFNSGYAANLALMSAIPQRGDLVLYDESVHASIREGLQLCLAKTVRFAHNDLEELDRAYRRNKQGTVYLVTESVYSMDGSVPDMEGFGQWATANQVLWILDEAHATGVLGEGGRGLGQVHPLFSRLMTFGKAMGCHGAVVLGSNKLKEYLVNFGRSFIYTTSMPPHSLAAISVAHKALDSTDGIKELNNNIDSFKELVRAKGLQQHFLPSVTAIQSCIVAGNDKAKQAAAALQLAGYDVRPILAPTVEQGRERLRFCIHIFNTKKEMEGVLSKLAQLL